jgi:HEAT repeat protein
MDGPFYALKRMNPYYRNEWKKDQKLGPTYAQRIEELQVLDKQIASMPPEDQERWAMMLEKMIQKEPSPEFRAKAIATISKVKTPATTRALNRASTDEFEKVRVAACKGWGQLREDAGREMLINLANSDESTSVRAAAINSLGEYNHPEVRQAFATLLDDRSPLIQFQVAQSLTKISGVDYGGDFDSWKKYLAGEQVPLPESKSMTARTLEAINIWK